MIARCLHAASRLCWRGLVCSGLHYGLPPDRFSFPGLGQLTGDAIDRELAALLARENSGP